MCFPQFKKINKCKKISPHRRPARKGGALRPRLRGQEPSKLSLSRSQNDTNVRPGPSLSDAAPPSCTSCYRTAHTTSTFPATPAPSARRTATRTCTRHSSAILRTPHRRPPRLTAVRPKYTRKTRAAASTAGSASGTAPLKRRRPPPRPPRGRGRSEGRAPRATCPAFCARSRQNKRQAGQAPPPAHVTAPRSTPNTSLHPFPPLPGATAKAVRFSRLNLASVRPLP